MKWNYGCVIHIHEFGTSVHFFKSRNQNLEEASIIKQLDVNFEPDKGENLEFCWLPLPKFKEVK